MSVTHGDTALEQPCPNRLGTRTHGLPNPSERLPGFVEPNGTIDLLLSQWLIPERHTCSFQQHADRLALASVLVGQLVDSHAGGVLNDNLSYLFFGKAPLSGSKFGDFAVFVPES